MHNNIKMDDMRNNPIAKLKNLKARQMKIQKSIQKNKKRLKEQLAAVKLLKDELQSLEEEREEIDDIINDTADFLDEKMR